MTQPANNPQHSQKKPNPAPGVKTNPVPGAEVTKPVVDTIDPLMNGLTAIINSIPPFPSTQAASQRLREAHFWILHALNDKVVYEKQMEEHKKAHEAKAKESEKKGH